MRITSFLPLVLSAGLIGHAAEPLPEPFIVRISEQWSTLQPTAGPNNVGNCLIVMPDGHLHLELRRQEFFDGTVVWTTYESVLDGSEIGILRSILNDAAVRKLRPFAQPVGSLNGNDSQTFTAEIVRGSQVQQVGYLTWHGIAPNNPEADKTAWKAASGALQHLVEWSHVIKSSKALNWRRVLNPKTTCVQ
jgi:hypothetical protein